MKCLFRAPVFLSALVFVSLVAAACAPAAAPTPTPTKPPAAAPTKAPEAKPTAPPAPSPAAPPKALAPYKIGVVTALSGAFSGLGVPARDGAVAAANEINAAGGINGRKLELVTYDDETDSTKAVLAVKKLIGEDKVVAIIGPTGSTVQAAQPSIEEGQVPAIVISGDEALVKPVKKWTFKFLPGQTRMMSAMYTYLKSKGVTKLAIFNPATATGKSATTHIQGTAPGAGFEIVANESYEFADKDFAPQLTKIKASGAQGMIIYDAAATVALIARQIKAMGLNIIWTGSFGIASPSIVEAAGDAYDGLVLPLPKVFVADQLPDSDPQKKVALQFIDAFKKTTGKEPNPNAMFGWDGILSFSEVLKKTNADPDKLAEARATIRDGIEGLKNFPAAVSVLSLSPADHEGVPPDWSVLAEIRGGKFRMLK